jgi:Uma2 family endonuclease
LTAWFISHENEWGTACSTEQRVQVADNRVRIPDIVVVPAGPQPAVLIAPPLLIVEVLSPDDTYSDTEDRIRDYHAMGVETVWIVDPKTRTGRVCTPAHWTEAPRLDAKGTPLYVQLGDIFSKLMSA